ncbi:MAG: GGDEF domain-containing protein [Gammaproteobacteria bacterium]|nr:GGDEF domain-containing protein [Gammaproteobacteria bacterium]
MGEELEGLVRSMDILPDGVLVLDSSRQIVACNRRLESLFGYAVGELVGQPLNVLVPVEARAAHDHHAARYAAGEAPSPKGVQPVFAGLSKSGQRVPVSIGLSRSVDRGETFVIAVVRDARSFDDTIEDAISLAETDPLTKLGNRRNLSSTLDRREAAGGATGLGMLYLDLDCFKPINDTHGHDVGDEVLAIVARRLRRSLRDDDSCIRMGGDEFVVVMANVTCPADLEHIAGKLHAAVSAPIRVAGLSLRVGVSIGGAIGRGPLSGDALVVQADNAMYAAKRAGRPYCFGGEIGDRSAA